MGKFLDSEFAPGIPDRSVKAKLPNFNTPQKWEFVLHAHDAERAGCLPPGARVLTDVGYIRISDIVNNKLNLNVRSYNFNTNLLEWKPIVNWFKNGSTDTWVNFSFKGNKGLTCTPNHNVYIKRDTQILKLAAKDVTIEDVFLMPDKNLSEDTKQFIYGAFLGDGSIVKRNSYKPMFSWGHSELQKEYAIFGAKLLNSNIEIRKSSKNRDTFYYTRNNHLFYKNLSSFYTPKKEIKEEFLNLLDERAIAVWFMDDGQWSPSKGYTKPLIRNTKRRKDSGINKFAGQIYFYTNGFTKDETMLLLQWLNSKYVLNFKLRKRGKYYYICQSGIEYNKNFFSLIAQYLHKSIQYKSPIPVGSYIWSNSRGENLFEVKIKDIKEIRLKQGINKNQKCSVSKYDIEVKDNHNYFSSDILISNSHYDLRLGDPTTGFAHSFVVRSWPKSGEKVLAVQQPTHTVKYMDFKGNIESGYGKGHVGIADRDQVEIIKSSPDKITFYKYKGGNTEKFSLIRTGDTNWLLTNHSNDSQAVGKYFKEYPKFKMKDISKTYVPQEDEFISPKLDGAFSTTILNPGKTPIVLGARISKKTNLPIQYAPKIFDLISKRSPKEFGTTVLQTEIFAVTPDNKELPNRFLAGILNSNVWESRKKQKELQAPLKLAITNVLKYKNKNVSDLPIKEKYKLIDEIAQQFPILHNPLNLQKKTNFEEGKIIWRGGVPHKVKNKIELDAYVREIFPAYSKDGEPLNRAGGFRYSWTPTSKIVGNVGTGFSHEELQDMRQHPENYIGRIATIYAMSKYPGTQSLRAPSFKTWSLDAGREWIDV